ncbi:hypothetical protein L6164_000907 [Bauhinia variegata]|uniref:Uncharacterized protein n=1 Tax=Bauhinia variegata TaxID=167791 RepID=A0ACB9QAN3_BAUVA|nr:hypothetical protein L6164_000907 [Bauhinia variegata]
MASILISSVSPGLTKSSLRCSTPSPLSSNQVLSDLQLRPLKHSHSLSCKKLLRSHSKFPSVTLASHSSATSSSSLLNKNISDNLSEVQNLKANNVSWIDSYLPSQLQPYARLARLDKPIGTWLLAWPYMWSIALAAVPGHLPDFKVLALFGCLALFIRGVACTINDFFDRDIDKMVERTKLRPLASGELTPFQGLCFLCFQLLLALGVGILLQLDNLGWTLGTATLFLLFTYPLMKRITYWPQAYLGFAFNLGALSGWQAIKGSLDLAIVLPLYASGVFWTLLYDTIYAHQDKEDDIKVGVKSTALLFGDSTKTWTAGFGFACIGCLALSGFNANIGWPYHAFLAAASGQLAWQVLTADLSSPADCSSKFVSNKWFGALIFGGILAGRLAF